MEIEVSTCDELDVLEIDELRIYSTTLLKTLNIVYLVYNMFECHSSLKFS